MQKHVFGLLSSVALLSAFAAEPIATAVITVDAAQELGPIRMMNAVNGGPKVAPVLGDQKSGNFEDFQLARIPYARTHDCVNCVSGGAHACDVNAIFPDFDANENDPKNYDFVFTDHYLDNMLRAGTKPFFRLGQTIEHGPKKYGVLPPKDFAKWARICEHIIRHYTEGWGWGVDKAPTTRNLKYTKPYDIAYWEIWNEPDLDMSDKTLPTSPRCWGGTVTNFFEFYETAAKHLKAKFPNLKIGGPAICGREDWAARFLAYCRDNQVPLDFFSWHVYAEEPANIASKCDRIRKLMDKYGFVKSESILNEWNYVKGWTDDWVYSREAESGRFNQKGAAFVAATMIDCQNKPLDMLMYYDVRPTGMNGVFAPITLAPMRGYYAYLAWSKLADCGTQVACKITEGRGSRSNAATGVSVGRPNQKGAEKGQFRAVAAKGADGANAIFIARYSSDDNTTDMANVWLSVPDVKLDRARLHLTDAVRIHTEVPVKCGADGTLLIRMQPNSFATVEW